MEERRCESCMKNTAKPVCEHCGHPQKKQNESHQLPVGTVLGERYQIGRVLGQGGFGITYLGWDGEAEKKVAIKEFYPSSTVNRDCSQTLFLQCNTAQMEPHYQMSRERFLREAKALSQLKDIPEIVGIKDFLEENNTAYIVMEYVQGMDLAHYVQRRGGRLTADETFRILRPLMEALANVHRHGLVHRDISPDNIILHPMGGAKLLDFGAVRSVENADTEKALTKSTEAILKHGFAPIEQYQTRGSLGPWTDEYAMCATVYYCLTGQIIEEATTRMAEEIDPDWSSIPGLTEEQIGALSKGLSVRAKDRFPGMDALIAVLFPQPAAQPEPVPAAQPGPVSVPQSGPVPVSQPEPPKSPKKKKSKAPLIVAACAAGLLLVAGALMLLFLKPKGPTIYPTQVGGPTDQGSSTPEETAPAEDDTIVIQTTFADYTYTDWATALTTNWNPHTYSSDEDAYPLDYLTCGLYTFVYNDSLHPVEGRDPYKGYSVIPEMAAELPVDVTETVRAAHPEFGIPEDATGGYAYTIDLNPLATWQDATPITADDYVESMKRLLDPKMRNPRANVYYDHICSIAGAKAYANSGRTIYNDSFAEWTMSELTRGGDGQYVAPNGAKMYIGLDVPLDWLAGDTLNSYVAIYGTEYFVINNWDTLMSRAVDGVIPLTDENLALFTPVVTGNPSWGETAANLPNYFCWGQDYPESEYDDTVGLYKSGGYQITLVLDVPLEGFELLYALTNNWLVKTDLYDACTIEQDGILTSTYNTSVDTTCSYGPYILTSYQANKSMHFEKNETWYGYYDNEHIYQDPTDGMYYPMYQTTAIDLNVITEADTARTMFLKGELMQYPLQTQDYATYRLSQYCYVTPSETSFFLILNGDMPAIQQRETAAGFDRSRYDLQTLTLKSFHQAIGLTYDRELFAAAISSSRTGAYGIIGPNYIYDPETGAKYRDSDQAKQVLCDFYCVDVSQFASLDEAVASITGCDPELARAFYRQAFEEAMAAGFITDNDGDGISDQTISIEYALSTDSDFMTTTLAYLNEKVDEVTAGTPFEGKINFYKSIPFGSEWPDKIKYGQSDTVLAGWSGSALDPFALTHLYVDPVYQYDAWCDTTRVQLTINVPVNGVYTDVTLSLKQWSDCLNGTDVQVDDVTTYNFGEAEADVETRLNILAACEGKILESYNYLPMLQNSTMHLLSQKAFYVVDEYDPILGHGGLAYLRYRYDDDGWAEYVASNNGTLDYTK